MKISVEELLNTSLNVLHRCYFHKSQGTLTLREWLFTESNKRIKLVKKIRKINQAGDIEKAKKYKAQHCPCVVLSAFFPDGYCDSHETHIFLPIISIDVDFEQNPNISDWNEAKQKAFFPVSLILISSFKHFAVFQFFCPLSGVFER